MMPTPPEIPFPADPPHPGPGDVFGCIMHGGMWNGSLNLNIDMALFVCWPALLSYEKPGSTLTTV